MVALSIIQGRQITGLMWCQTLDSECHCLFMSTATQCTTTDPEIPHAPFPQLFFPLCPSWILSLFFSLPVISGMTGNYLLTNPLLRTHDTNPYNNLLAETVVCNTPSPPAFHSPGAHLPSIFILTYIYICFKATIDILGNVLIYFLGRSKMGRLILSVH